MTPRGVRIASWASPLAVSALGNLQMCAAVRMQYPRIWREVLPGLAVGRVAYFAISPLIIAMVLHTRFDQAPARAIARVAAGMYLLLLACERSVALLTGEPPELTLNRSDVDLTIALIVVTLALQAWSERRSRRLERARADFELAVANMRLLDVQLRPHFVFNCLNSVLGLAADDVQAARRLVVALREFLALMLEGSGAVIPLADELAIVQRYSAIEQIRFGDALQLVFDIEPAALGRAVPRMLLQPLVENAIRHGGTGEIVVKASIAGGTIRIAVVNRRMDPPPEHRGEGIGLSNARARLRAVFGSEASLAVLTNRKGYSSVEMNMPARVANGA